MLRRWLGLLDAGVFLLGGLQARAPGPTARFLYANGGGEAGEEGTEAEIRSGTSNSRRRNEHTNAAVLTRKLRKSSSQSRQPVSRCRGHLFGLSPSLRPAYNYD